MSDYRAPLADMTFVLNELAGLAGIAKLPGYEEATPDTVAVILEEASRFASEVLDPLNASGDREGSRLLADGTVKTPPGFRDAYLKYVENGWNGLTKPVDFGGQGLPQLVAAAVEEMWHAANMAFDLCPLLTQGAIEAIDLCGTPEQKARFLPPMVAGKWTGTMNLTEPQAGSDLAAVRTRAVPQPDGSYRLFGQKIFITFGEHDYTENIIHLVLARLPDAPEGVKGISLFIVPKVLVNADGSLGARNDVRCVSLEHKLGIHASPTAVLAYGDHGGATGYLVGEANRGLEYMFIMMNLARFSVGMEGVGLAERAYQRAVAYARDRVQGRTPAAGAATIIGHPDVRRMLMTMRASTEAMRAVGCVTAAGMDRARRSRDAGERKAAQAFVDFMIPIVKGWCTETAQEVTSLGIQVHGGMGYIEETGAAQYYRDARIITIYEGTTGIQANDLVGRKTQRDGGAEARRVAAEADNAARICAAHADPSLAAIGRNLADAVAAMREAIDWVVGEGGNEPSAAYAGAVPYLRLCGLVAGGLQMARAATIARGHLDRGEGDAAFHTSKIATARFYAEALLPHARPYLHAMTAGSAAALALAVDAF
ncbi:MAG: acyl-CoA dehydrogenase [Proteobacteria bacterium]|jgi:alkylation response protein AidB-like acyl-CoA dehydrogenase|nr:acyl-CoA dehydrogenase [Pseudomonadota bacterium]